MAQAGAPRTSAQKAAIEERRTKAMEMHLMGFTYEEIALAGIGYSPDLKNPAGTISTDITRALESRRKARDEMALLVVQREIQKLDLMERAAWKVLRARHYVVNQGVVVWHNPGEEPDERVKRGWANVRELHDEVAERVKGSRPLEDDAPVLKACETLLKIAERRAKLLGLDAPVKKIVEVETGAGVDERIAALLAELAGGGQGPSAASPAAGEDA